VRRNPAMKRSSSQTWQRGPLSSTQRPSTSNAAWVTAAADLQPADTPAAPGRSPAGGSAGRPWRRRRPCSPNSPAVPGRRPPATRPDRHHRAGPALLVDGGVDPDQGSQFGRTGLAPSGSRPSPAAGPARAGDGDVWGGQHGGQFSGNTRSCLCCTLPFSGSVLN